MTDQITIVFVCVENSNRSQMAEAFARLCSNNRVNAFSAGSRPSGSVNPKAITAMKDFGYDLSTHRSKSLDDLPAIDFDAVVTMGCGDSCPNISSSFRDDWSLPDPRDMNPETYRQICQVIREKVQALLKNLGVEIEAAPTKRV